MELLRDQINQNLPAAFKISARGAARARQLGFSEEVVMHMLLDRLEAQLSTLDVTTDGIVTREWQASPIAVNLFKEMPELNAFKTPYNTTQRAARKSLIIARIACK